MSVEYNLPEPDIGRRGYHLYARTSVRVDTWGVIVSVVGAEGGGLWSRPVEWAISWDRLDEMVRAEARRMGRIP